METYHRQREPRQPEITGAKRGDQVRRKAMTGEKIIIIAKELVGCHYINGGYGATPGGNDGFPGRPGGIKLVASEKRLNPAKQPDKINDLAVLAAQMTVNRHCICGGKYNNFSGAGSVNADDRELLDYLKTLQGETPALWEKHKVHLTPRRVYGPAAGGDIGGKLVWGQSCKGFRHFDCVGFISFCLWKATGKEIQLEISEWRKPNQPMIGSKVYDLSAGQRPEKLMAADILIKADHHIAWVNADGTIVEAADTDLGVIASGKFVPGDAKSTWTHLVRLPL